MSSEIVFPQSRFGAKITRSICNRAKLNEVPSANLLPGIPSLISAPFYIYSSFYKIRAASLLNDRVTQAGLGVEILQHMINWYHSAIYCIVSCQIFHSAVFFSEVSFMTCFCIFLAMVSTTIEGIREAIAAKKQIRFYNSPLFEFSRFLEKETWKEDPAAFEQVFYEKLEEMLGKGESLEKFKERVEWFEKLPSPGEKPRLVALGHIALLEKAFSKYFNTSNVRERLTLERTVGQRMSAEFETRAPSLANQILSENLSDISDEVALKEVQCLFQNLKIQAVKKLIIHLLGLTVASLAFLGLSLALFIGMSSPIVLGVILFSFIPMLMRYLMVKGMLEEKGWNFNAKACIPQFSLEPVKRIWRQIKGPAFFPVKTEEMELQDWLPKFPFPKA